MKKKYNKPDIRIVSVHHRTSILTGSLPKAYQMKGDGDIQFSRGSTWDTNEEDLVSEGRFFCEDL
jgi:hypothetical protein